MSYQIVHLNKKVGEFPMYPSGKLQVGTAVRFPGIGDGVTVVFIKTGTGITATIEHQEDSSRLAEFQQTLGFHIEILLCPATQLKSEAFPIEIHSICFTGIGRRIAPHCQRTVERNA